MNCNVVKQKMRGMNGAMRKRAKPEADMFINSNIMISMDQKIRHRSNYMKKHNENMKKVQIMDYSNKEAAGGNNYNNMGPNTSNQVHINQSRRRILNDFTKTPEDRHRTLSVDYLVNHNLNDALKVAAPNSLRYDLSNHQQAKIDPNNGMSTPNSVYNLPQINNNGSVERHNRAAEHSQRRFQTLNTPRQMQTLEQEGPTMYDNISQRDSGSRPRRLFLN